MIDVVSQPSADGGTPAAPVDDEETKELQRERARAETRKATAEAEKAIAEAQQATLAAQLPSSDVKPIEGKTEVGEKVGLVAELVAHSLLDDAAQTIAANVPARARALIVEDRQLVAGDWPYQIVHRHLEQQAAALQQAREALEAVAVLAPETPAAEPEVVPLLAGAAAAAAAAQAFAGVAATLVGMFRTDYAITHRDVTMSGTPLVAAVACAVLAGDDRAVVVDAFHELDDSQVITKFAEVAQERSAIEQLALVVRNSQVVAAAHRAEDLRAEAKAVADSYDKALAGGTPQPPDLSALKGRLEELQTARDGAEAALPRARAAVLFADVVLKRFDAFATSVLTAAKEGAYPPLVAAAVRERLHAGGDDRITHVLYVNAEAAGAETIARHGLFGRSGRMGYLGGVQVTFLLHDVDLNATVAAGTQPLLGHMHYDLGDGRAERVKRVTLTPDEQGD